MAVNYNPTFILGIAFILVHEMDAVRCREWRIFPGLSLLNDRMGMTLFVLLHIPVFYWLNIKISQGHPAFIQGFDIFLIVHLFLHILFTRHKNNEFKDWLSWLIIAGAGLCGAIDLWLVSMK